MSDATLGPVTSQRTAHTGVDEFQEFEESEVGDLLHMQCLSALQLERATTAGGVHKQLHQQRDYHIIWSRTFGAPVLYFNICAQGTAAKIDNPLLPHCSQTVLRLITRQYGCQYLRATAHRSPIALPSSHRRCELILCSAWSRCSHAGQDHPYLNVPFYYVHPCQTSKLLAEAGLRYDTALDVLKCLLCVLSIAGPIVSLTYPHEWFLLAPLKEVHTPLIYATHT